MSKHIFKYLVPVYILYFIGHMVFFFTFVLTQMANPTPHFGLLILLFASHFLVIMLGIAFTVYMIVDCALRKFKNESEKIMWVIILCIISILGAIIYYYAHGHKELPR